MVLWAGTTLVIRSRATAEGPGAFGEPMRQLLMELAIFGFSLNAIYGFSPRLLSGIVGSATPRGEVVEAAFWLHNAGVVLLAVCHTREVALAGPLGVAAVAAGAFCYAVGMRGFAGVRRTSPRPEVGPGVLGRYVQLAFFWLLAGLVLLLAANLYWRLRPHAAARLPGAVRHALTVGFMTTLILGVGRRLLPILGHRLLPWPPLVLPTFLLIAVGNVLALYSRSLRHR